MKVPILERQVQENPALLPTLQVSGAVPGAFGENVAIATKELGKSIGDLGTVIAQHALKQQDFANKAKNYELEKKLDTDFTNKLTSTEEETYEVVDASGKKTPNTRPAGILNQTGYMANEASLRWNQYAIPKIDEYASQIKSPEYQLQFKENAYTQYRTHYNTIISHEQQQMTQANKDTIDAKLQTNANLFPAASPEDKTKIITDAHATIAAGYNRGLYTYEQAQKKIEDFNGPIVKTDIYNDNSTQETQSKVLAELKKGDKGSYVFLSQDERLKMIEDSQRRIFQNNQTYKRQNEEIKDVRFDGIFQKGIDGTLSLQDIDNELAIPEEQGGISKKELLQIKKGIETKIKSDLEVIIKDSSKAEDYLKFIDNFIDDETDRQKAREYLAKAYSDGILSPKEGKFLNTLKKKLEDIQWNNTDNLFKNTIEGWKVILKSRKSATNNEIALGIKELIQGISNGKNPTILLKEILNRDAIKRNPAIQTFNENGQMTMDEQGNTAIVKPDASYEEK